jgi:small subunit ribosomal protein S15
LTIPSIFEGLKGAISWPPSGSNCFHTFHPVQETRRSRLARASKKDNADRRAERARDAKHTRPDPILGHSPGDDSKWLNCDLAKVLVSQAELQPPSMSIPLLDTTQPLKSPEHFQWGIGGDPQLQHFLLESVPEVSSQQRLKSMDVVNPQDATINRKMFKAQWDEMHNAHMLTRLMDLRNASAAGIAFENRRRCVEAFSPPDKPNDTGRPEVQGLQCSYA